MIVTLIVLLAAALLFVDGRLRADLVAVCATLALVLAGVLSPEEALAGFAHPVVAMMAGLFVVGGGIFGTGLAKKLGTGMLGLAGRSETRLFVLLMLTTSFVGAFVSNTGTVALMLPIVVSMARSAGLQPARFLMPLAFAGSMGGMLTLIGTPPNLIVRDALAAAGYAPLKFFSFTPVGVICVAVGTAVLIPLSARFLRERKGKGDEGREKSLRELSEEYGLTRSLAEARVAAGSPMAGHSLRELDIYGRYGVNVVEILRMGSQGMALRKVEQFAMGDVALLEGDRLLLSGEAAQTARLAEDMGLALAAQAEGEGPKMNFYDVGMAEIVVMGAAPVVGLTVEEADFRDNYGLNVLGIKRQDAYIRENLKQQRLHAADIVLVQGTWENIARLNRQEGREWVVVGQPAERAQRVTLDYKAPLAALIMLAMVVVMAVDAIPVAPVTAVAVAAVLMVATGCVRGVEGAYRTINWESIVLFGAMLPMSTALEKTGASDWLSTALVGAVGDLGPYALLAAVYVATSLLTFFISNTVTAVLMAPIALSAAHGMGVSAVPVLMAVTVAASMCFASPFSTPPNALVMAAGGYKPADYLKVGLPLQVAIGAAMVAALPALYGF